LSKFRTLETILKKNEDTNLSYLANLFSISGNHEKSEEYWMKYLEKNKHDADAYAALGLTQFNLGKNKESVASYNRAVELSPDNLDYRCNLAKAYSKLGSHVKSEFEFMKVLEVSAYHIDSILGISELYSTMGDSLESKDDSDEASEKYTQALIYLNEALDLADGDDYEFNEASKKLNKTEISELYYSIGYVKIKLFELQKRRDNKLLTDALRNFKRVKQGTLNYYKAGRAIKKINERFIDFKEAGSRRGALLVVIVASILFISSQLAFYIGRPVLVNTNYSIDAGKLNSILTNEKLSLAAEDKLLLTSFKSFTPDKIIELLNDKLKIDAEDKINFDNLIQTNNELDLKEFSPIDATLYGILTFGSLIFIIAGLYLKELSKLRLGAIELEKTTGQQVTLPSSLGISR
jgi:tetratricopeptide (TPR) repeat protein